MAELVSVIIPCYNVAPYLEECLDSVLNQTYKPLEVICVDNNSTDNTKEVLIGLQASHNLVIEEELKPGACAARNKGLSICKGIWVQFLDADDLLFKDKISTQMESVSDDADFVVSDYLKRAVDGKESEISCDDDIWKGLFTTRAGITSSALFRTESVRKVEGWDEGLESSQEYDLMFRLLNNGCNATVSHNARTIVRERESGQISQSNPEARWERYIALRERILARLKSDQPEYFAREQPFYYQHLFDHIRTLANYNLNLASEYFKKLIPADFRPAKSEATGSAYLFLYKILGFRRSEQLKKMMS